MNKLFSLLVIASICVFTTSCSKDDTPNVTGAKTQFQIFMDDSPGSLGFNSTPGFIQFTSGFANIDEIELEAESEETEIAFEQDQGIRVEFNGSTPAGGLNDLVIPPGTYEEVEFDVELSPTATEPAMVIYGTFTDSQDTNHDVEIQFNVAMEFQAESENITFAADQTWNSMLSISPLVWLTGVTLSDLESATQDANGKIIISTDVNPTFYQDIMLKINQGTNVELSEE